MENINIRSGTFEGPFDLLLRLIKINKMEITDISIYEITDQYMDVIKSMEELDMEVASEFFVLSATLIEMKSRALLPKRKDDEDEPDSGEMLLNKLKEYEFFKEAALILNEKYSTEDVIVTRLPMTIEEDVEKVVEIVIPEGFNQERFFLLYMELLDRQKEKTNTVTNIDRRIPIDYFKVEEKMEELTSWLKEKRRMSFSAVMEESSCKAETIVLFLAVLELVRNHSVKVYQEDILGELIIENS